MIQAAILRQARIPALLTAAVLGAAIPNLMCENVNAAPQVSAGFVPVDKSVPAGAAPFTLLHPLCQTGFTVAQRFDQRNPSGAIIKSVWVRKCVRVPRIVYGRKV